MPARSSVLPRQFQRDPNVTSQVRRIVGCGPKSLGDEVGEFHGVNKLGKCNSRMISFRKPQNSFGLLWIRLSNRNRGADRQLACGAMGGHRWKQLRYPRTPDGNGVVFPQVIAVHNDSKVSPPHCADVPNSLDQIYTCREFSGMHLKFLVS